MLRWVWKWLSNRLFTISAKRGQIPALENHNEDKDNTSNSHKHHRDGNSFPPFFIPSCQDSACEEEHRKSGAGARYRKEDLAGECESDAWSYLVHRDIPSMAIPSIAKLSNERNSDEGCCWDLIS
jgi:hypothetical protein